MQQCAMADQPIERLRGEQRQLVCLLFQPAEKLRVSNEGNFYSLSHAGALVATGENIDKRRVVYDRCGRLKCSEQILDAECVHTILHPDAGVVLSQNRRRHSDMPHTSMCRCGDVADEVQYCPTTDPNDVRMSIHAHIDEPTLKPVDQIWIVFANLSARQNFNWAGELKCLCMTLRIDTDAF